MLFGSFLLIPQLLELAAATGYGFGKTVTQAGLFLLPLTAAQLVFGPVSGILEGRLGARVPLLLGSILGVAADVVPAISHAASWLLLLSAALSGIGIGLAQAAMTNAIIESVPHRRPASPPASTRSYAPSAEVSAQPFSPRS